MANNKLGMKQGEGIGLAGSERRGRDEIAMGIKERRAAGVQGPGSGTMHIVATSTVVFEFAMEAIEYGELAYRKCE